MMTYFQSTRPGYLKLFCTPFDSFWCCTGTGIENHAKYGDSIYFHGTPDGPHKDTLFVNLFIASTVNWNEKGIVLKQTTSFPETGKIRLEVTSTSPQKFTLNLRHPAWAANATVTVNGSRQAISSDPGTYVALNRDWKPGDVVELDLPMALHGEPLPGIADRAAIMYGPIVLVGLLGHDVKPGEDLIVNERNIGNSHNEHIDVPTLAGDLDAIPAKIKSAGAPLTFKTDGIGKPNEVTLVPYFKTAHQHYNMYWKIQPA